MNLKKELSLIDVFCVATGAMISSGLFILPGLAYAKSGPAAIFSYLLAGILVIPAMLAKAELATAMPKAGGDYFFIERSMGAAPGILGGIAAWFSLSFKSAFALVGIGAFAVLINPNITSVQIKLIAVGCCLFFMIVNLIGAKLAGRFQVFMVLFLLSILAFYIFRGSSFIQSHRYIPFIPLGFSSIFATAGLVFVSYGGLTKVVSVAEEVKNPGRNIPLGMFLAFITVLILYVFVVFVTIGLVDAPKLQNSLTPISLGASTFMGVAGSIIMAIAALLAFVSTANAGIMAASRTPMAMSRDRLLPKFFQRVNLKFSTPHFSILFTSAFMIAVISFLGLENLVKTASTMKILLFAFVNLAIIIMRESKIQNYQPKFRSPLYPWLQIFGIIGYGFLIVEMGTIPLMITGIFIVCGLVWYLIYARSRVKRESALIHVVERITAKELTSYSLETELKEILKERDEIIEDRFDHVIKESLVLDIEGSLDIEEFFRKVSNALAEELNMDSKRLFDLFMARESQSSTVLRPGLAIPHIVIEGEHKFKILLVRCKDGIVFSDSLPKVHIAFVLVVSRDERNFYLRALAAIAQVAQEADFDDKWLSARSMEGLRDIVLLGKRRRYTPR
ncbi:MAG TPA: amino acid permease [bacterium (Candidatus Stahlbacteria)]|nr:amino acid permease [Candidatus Stahlbacteria bacterium]